jgi:uncharacterized protein YndB with AHSA1/START domain
MSPRPTGRVTTTAHGADLVIERKFNAPIEDVWTSVTASESTARWIGSWSGEPGAGKTVRFQMLFEKDAPPCDVLIEVCDAPRRLVVAMKDDHGDWHLELKLETSADVTTLTFVQHLEKPASVGDTGPGWEYYLDMLVASRTGAPLPIFDDYYPSQREHYLAQVSG